MFKAPAFALRSGQGIETLWRFAIVGVITTALDVLIFAGLTAAAAAPALANLLSYSCGIAVSYLLNRSWTFSVEGTRLQALKFVLSTLAGLLISTILVTLLTTMIAAIHAKAISVPLVFVWNYLSARLWVFNTGLAGKDYRG